MHRHFLSLWILDNKRALVTLRKTRTQLKVTENWSTINVCSIFYRTYNNTAPQSRRECGFSKIRKNVHLKTGNRPATGRKRLLGVRVTHFPPHRLCKKPVPCMHQPLNKRALLRRDVHYRKRFRSLLSPNYRPTSSRYIFVRMRTCPFMSRYNFTKNLEKFESVRRRDLRVGADATFFCSRPSCSIYGLR